MTPEQGTAFNAAPMPPREYLMRRSYNPNDIQIPGAIAQEWRCPRCGCIVHDPRAAPHDAWRLAYRMAGPYCTSSAHKKFAHDAYPSGPQMTIYSVDVPLVKSNGERWQ